MLTVNNQTINYYENNK